MQNKRNIPAVKSAIAQPTIAQDSAAAVQPATTSIKETMGSLIANKPADAKVSSPKTPRVITSVERDLRKIKITGKIVSADGFTLITSDGTLIASLDSAGLIESDQFDRKTGTFKITINESELAKLVAANVKVKSVRGAVGVMFSSSTVYSPVNATPPADRVNWITHAEFSSNTGLGKIQLATGIELVMFTELAKDVMQKPSSKRSNTWKADRLCYCAHVKFADGSDKIVATYGHKNTLEAIVRLDKVIASDLHKHVVNDTKQQQ